MPDPVRMRRLSAPRVRVWRVVLRVAAWSAALLWIGLGSAWARRDTERRVARVLHHISRLGPVACAVAREFSHRIDLLPPALALDLVSLDTRMPDVPAEQITALVEEAVGGPLHEHFEMFDPKALGSRTVRCTYQGTLRDGRAVVVRVRRPGIRQMLAEELAAVGLLLRAAEVLTLVRPGLFSHLRREIRESLLGECDFRLWARRQALSAQRIRRDKLRFVQVPEVVSAYVSDAVIVAEYVEGHTLAEVLHAIESDDQEMLRLLALKGIRPRKLARRLLQLSWWELNEHLFFHSALGAEDAVALPGGRLSIVHFEDCGTTSSDSRRLLLELYRRLADGDATGATHVMVSMLEPLPFIDVDTFTREVEGRVWQELFALRDEEAHWSERTTAGLWVALLDVARKHRVVVHHDIIRIVRASIVFGALSARLWPKISPLEEFARYQRRSDRRTVRNWRRDMKRRTDGDPGPLLGATMVEAITLTQRAMFYARRVVEQMPLANLAMPRKAAYAAIVLLRASALALAGTAAVGAGRVAYLLATRGSASPIEATQWALEQPLLWGAGALLLLITLRRLLFRLSDVDQD